jgi:hypothetical protein
MRMMLIALAGAALLGGCSTGPLGRMFSSTPPVDTRPGANLPGGATQNRRQMYDERVGRFYYFDLKTGRYYWENGDPRF